MNWNRLLYDIARDNVVLVLGDGVFSIQNEDGNRVKVIDYVRQTLIKRYNVSNCDESSPNQQVEFSTIAEHILLSNFQNNTRTGQKTIHSEVFDLLDGKSIQCDESIKRLLSLNHFPLVISTSYLDQIPSLLGIDDNRVSYYEGSTDVVNTYSLSAQYPTLFYMFGRANQGSLFMVTEEDFLQYLHLWHSIDTRPKALCDYLKKKYLLVLGCNFPNWVFRFLWHSMRSFEIPELLSSGNLGVVSVENHQDFELRRFLSRVQVETCDKVDTFVNVLFEKWETFSERHPSAIQPVVYDDEIFISYAHEDYLAAKSVAMTFKNKGANVWFDEALDYSSNPWKNGCDVDTIIEERIRHAKRFVPIISRNAVRRYQGYFRKEWSWAIDEMQYRTGSEYIAPVRVDDCPIDARSLPKEFKKKHCIDYFMQPYEAFEKAIVDLIRLIQRENAGKI